MPEADLSFKVFIRRRPVDHPDSDRPKQPGVCPDGCRAHVIVLVYPTAGE